jgi:hypothetical protein
MEKAIIQSLNDPAKYITEIIDKRKKGHHITYQKRSLEAKFSE